MKLHGDCEQLIFLQIIMETSGIYLAELILFNSKKKSPLKMPSPPFIFAFL